MTTTIICPRRFDELALAWTAVLKEDGHTVNPMTDDRSKKDRQLERSDSVLLINLFGYLGQDSLLEYRMARAWGCEVFAIESWGKGNGIDHRHFDHIQAAVKNLVPFYVGATLDTTSSNDARLWHDLIREPAGSKRYRMIEKINGCEERFVLEASKMTPEAVEG